jgi:hypothetical protein
VNHRPHIPSSFPNVMRESPRTEQAFFHFGCIPIDSKLHEAKLLTSYFRAILDAVVRNVASHAATINTPDVPCLVEVHCRCNGRDGIWRPLCRALAGGYTQVEACADAYYDTEAFKKYPDTPPSPIKAAGLDVELVSYSSRPHLETA